MNADWKKYKLMVYYVFSSVKGRIVILLTHRIIMRIKAVNMHKRLRTESGTLLLLFIK